MTQTEHLVNRLPNDIGGLPGEQVKRVEQELEPWEKRCHALADVLDFHKIINTEEKRCGVEALGAEMIGKLTYYERWIVAFANILFRKGIIMPKDLALKMDEVAHGQDIDTDFARPHHLGVSLAAPTWVLIMGACFSHWR